MRLSELETRYVLASWRLMRGNERDRRMVAADPEALADVGHCMDEDGGPITFAEFARKIVALESMQPADQAAPSQRQPMSIVVPKSKVDNPFKLTDAIMGGIKGAS